MSSATYDELFEEEPRDRRARWIALAALLVLALFSFILLRGGSEPPPSQVATTTQVQDQSPSDEAGATQTKASSTIETFELFAPKDPFDPVIAPPRPVEPATGTATVGEVAPVPASSGISESDGTTTITTSGSDAPASSASDGYRVKVIEVYRSGAQIQVNGTVYTVDGGERFAQNFELMSSSGACATMLFGDDEFTLCEGEEILK